MREPISKVDTAWLRMEQPFNLMLPVADPTAGKLAKKLINKKASGSKT